MKCILKIIDNVDSLLLTMPFTWKKDSETWERENQIKGIIIKMYIYNTCKLLTVVSYLPVDNFNMNWKLQTTGHWALVYRGKLAFKKPVELLS